MQFLLFTVDTLVGLVNTEGTTVTIPSTKDDVSLENTKQDQTFTTEQTKATNKVN